MKMILLSKKENTITEIGCSNEKCVCLKLKALIKIWIQFVQGKVRK